MPKPCYRLVPVLLAPSAAFAAPADAGASVLTMMFGLAVVLACIYGLMLLAKRVQASTGTGQAAVRIIGGASVGPRERVVLVEVGGKVLVLGVAPGRVNALDTLNADDVPRVTAAPIDSDFQRKLATLLKGGRREA
ncbi:flagellar biosynthetic protein FliO [Niveibacterium sp. 24ML]|uniref:flagellar biosynthetic protein FliO n=1 Tax=Niveibacterium sp. 24ML TaxID=2985512 RepID=UPI0022705BFF|nr:flagellar biosynthetic protein FliO [Niveibacterium sp. 24ML]MCX9157944.1 flagellar biosynthetic protein FliO [Niveibacterium sp. 24ML]